MTLAGINLAIKDNMISSLFFQPMGMNMIDLTKYPKINADWNEEWHGQHGGTCDENMLQKVNVPRDMKHTTRQYKDMPKIYQQTGYEIEYRMWSIRRKLIMYRAQSQTWTTANATQIYV